jgi:hypothetical protein
MDSQHERIAKTEALFRDVNERIAEASERLETDSGTFMCECADPACVERLDVPLDEYEDVRADPAQFVLDPDHVRPEVERVMSKGRGYAIVQKFGVVGRIARRLNPRTA